MSNDYTPFTPNLGLRRDFIPGNPPQNVDMLDTTIHGIQIAPVTHDQVLAVLSPVDAGTF